MKANHEKLVALLRSIEPERIDVVITPECFLDGYVSTENHVTKQAARDDLPPHFRRIRVSRRFFEGVKLPQKAERADRVFVQAPLEILAREMMVDGYRLRLFEEYMSFERVTDATRGRARRVRLLRQPRVHARERVGGGHRADHPA